MRRLVAAAAVIVITVAVAAPSLTAAGRSLVLGLELPAARQAADRVAALWRVTGPDSGGYSSTHDLDPAFDLYATAWNLRLAHRYHAVLPDRVDVDRVAAALREVLDKPAPVDGLPELETLRLAVLALRDLGVTPPGPLVAARLGELSTTGGFAFTPGGPATMTALAAAVETMSAGGLAPDESTVRLIVRQLASAGGEASIQEMADTWVPAWLAADIAMTPAERRAAVPSLTAQLAALWQALLAAPAWDGPTLSLAADARSVASANGVSLPPITPAAWADLELGDGYLRMSASESRPDPQTTDAAAALGRPMPAILAASSDSAATPLGWTSAPVDPYDTAMADTVLSAMNMDSHRSEVARESAVWLADLQATIQDVDSLRANLRPLAAYNRVATLVGASRWMPQVTMTSEQLATWNRREVGWLARAYLLGEMRPSPDVTRAFALQADPAPESMEDALSVTLLKELVDEGSGSPGIQPFIQSLRSGALYRAAPETSTPDLRSTSIAYALQRSTSVDAARQFQTEAGFSSAANPSITSDAGTLEDAYLALSLATGVDNLAALP